MRKVASVAAAAVVVALVPALGPAPGVQADTAPAQPQYVVTDLGTFGGPDSMAEAIDDQGDVVGWADAPPPPGTATTVEYAFLYHNGVKTNLGTLGATKPPATGYTVLSDARAINDSGLVVGSAQTADNVFHAFLASTDGSPLSDISGGVPYSFGQGINSSGTVVGVASTSPEYPAVWTTSSKPQNLYDLGCAFRADHNGDGAAFAVDDSGDIVGQAPLEGTLGQELRHAFKCVPKGDGTYAMHDLGPIGTTDSAAYAINNDAVAVGKSTDLNGVTEATEWDADGNATHLGTSPAGYQPPDGDQSVAYGINANGDAVGTFHYAGGMSHAFLYQSGTGMADLNSFLPSGSPWVLTEARAIDTAGDIVGQGRINGSLHAFLMSVAAPQLDIKATGIEVTQTIQDVDNTVTLVAGKRTFAMVHAETNGKTAVGVTARLYGSRGGTSLGAPLVPVNDASGRINVVRFPWRSRLNDSFLFELPPGWTAVGGLELRAEVNQDKSVTESDYGDDTVTTDVVFHTAPQLKLRLLNVEYPSGDQKVKATPHDLAVIASGLRRMYPANVSIRNEDLRTAVSWPSLNTSTTPTGAILLDLALENLRLQTDALGDDTWYATVTDKGGYMRGATPFGWMVASGPTGDPCGAYHPAMSCQWDGDGSYGDWMATHEIAHSLGRHHVNDCGTADPYDPYPNPYGYIGGPTATPSRYLGFDSGDAALGVPDVTKSSSWSDNMTYCPFEWMSATTYEVLYQAILHRAGQTDAEAGASPAAALAIGASAPAANDVLAVDGVINLSSDQADLAYVSREPSGVPTPEPAGADYHLQLVDASGTVLADHPFEPVPVAGGAGDADGAPMAVIDDVVPFVAGTRHVVVHSDIAGKDIGSIDVSAGVPTVSVSSPTSGAALPASGDVTFGWAAKDPDGDALTYTVLYSGDDKQTWHPLADRISATTLTVDGGSLPGTPSGDGYLRVIANDGVNTATADAGPFTVPNKAPTVHIEAPVSGSTWSQGQAVMLSAAAVDPQDGQLADSHLSWSSDLDGPLGTGSLVLARSLSVGTHTITLTATDAEGRSTTAAATVTIVTDAAQPGPTLAVDPPALHVAADGAAAAEETSLAIRNDGTGDLTWTATSDDPRVTLDAASGAAPALVGITADTSGLTAGQSFIAHVTVTSSDAGGSPIVVPVLVDSTRAAVSLPATVDFGSQQVLTTTPPRQVSVSYAGAGTLDLSTPTVVGAAPGDFAIADDGCGAASLPSGASCAVTVTFTAHAAGDRAAYLVFADSRSDQKWYVALTGVGAGVVTHTLAAWGDNYTGEVGVAPENDCTCESTPVQVPGLDDVTDVATGAEHTVALRSDGTVWTWGSNWFGQLGTGPRTPPDSSNFYREPAHPTPTQVPGVDDAIAVAATRQTSMALKKDGTVVEWGINGLGTSESSPTPVIDSTTGQPLDHVVAIAGGSDGSDLVDISAYALKSDGTVWAWGQDDGGELGMSCCNSAKAVEITAADGTPFSGVTAISYLMALKSDGTVWTWGSNYSGQLGAYDYPTVSRYTKALHPVEVTDASHQPLTGIVGIASWKAERFALKSDGTVWAWGGGDSRGTADRDLGTGTSSYRELVANASPVLGPGATGQLDGVTQIGAGIALKGDGSVWSWGDAGYGGLGNGSLTQVSGPVQVAGIGGAGHLQQVTMVVGGAHRVAVRRSIANPSAPPTVTGTLSRSPDGGTWYNHAVTVTWSANDPSASCDAPTTYDGPDGAGVDVTGHCTGSGGTGAGSVTFDYDGTPPTITVDGIRDGGTYTNTVSPTVNVTDVTSGTTNATVLLDGAPYRPGTPVTAAGPHLLTVEATDAAGNTATSTVRFHLVHTTALHLVAPADGDFDDPVELAATLVDTSSTVPAPVAGERVTIALGAQQCSAATDSTGTATCTLTPRVTAGPYELVATYGGSDDYVASSGVAGFTVDAEETTLHITSPQALPSSGPMTVRATLDEDSSTPIAGRTVRFTAGSVSVAATTDATGTASATLSLTPSAYALKASFDGDAYYRAASDTQALYVYQPTHFVIWGGNAPTLDKALTVDEDYTFWGSRWADQVTAGEFHADPAFKGYADTVSATSWSARSGNASEPPATVDGYVGVIVATRACDCSPGTTSGDVAALAVLKVDPGYAPSPGHTGTGTLLVVVPAESSTVGDSGLGFR